MLVTPFLYFCLTRIAHGNSPEEVAKWREERRSKFPTKAVVEEKMARQKELKERGEVGFKMICLIFIIVTGVGSRHEKGGSEEGEPG